MVPVSLDTIFCYLFNFCTAFVASFLGSICINLLSPLETRKKRQNTISLITKAVCYSVLVALFMCAVYEYLNLSYSLYMAVSGFLGSGGSTIFRIFGNKNFVVKFLASFLKNFKNIFFKSLSDALEEDSDEKGKNKGE